MRNRFFTSVRASLAAAFLVSLIVGCHNGGSGSTTTSSSAATTISGYPTTAVTVSPGQGVVLTATVTNDQKGDGVNWTLAGPGTLSNSTNSAPATNTVNTITYTAGLPTSTTTATVTATSIAVPTLSITFTINLESGLAISTASLPNGTLFTAYSTTLTSTGGTSPVTYTLTSGSLATGLTLSNTGVISGTPTIATPFTFTVQATDSSTTPLTATKTFTLTVIGPLTITSGNTAAGEIALPFRFVETATGGVAPYTWSLTQGTLPMGLMLSSTTGTTSGTPTGTAGPSTVTLTVTDSTGATVSHIVTITINAARTNAGNAELKGQYAFLLSGFDTTGNPIAAAGSFTADGAGNVTTGVMDTNGTALTAAQTSVAITAATYSVGTGNRGKLTITTAAGSMTFVVALNSIASGVAAQGFMLEFDGSGQSLTGALALQNAAAFSTTAITGGYAFGLSGFAASAANHAGAVGELQLSAGSLLSGEMVESTHSGAPLAVASGSYTVATNGRGTLTLTLPSGYGTLHFATYPVSTKLLYLLSTDAANGSLPLLSGQASAQTILNGSFSVTSLKGTAVQQLSRVLAVTSSASNVSEVAVGLYTFNGTGNATLTNDTNDAGVDTNASTTSAYTVAANGRAVITTATGIGGCEDCTASQVISYLSGANQGYALDLLTGIGTGTFQPQTQTAFTVTSLNGAYAAGSVQPAVPATLSTAELTANGAGAVDGIFDINSPAALAPDSTVTFTATVGANGRTMLTGSDGSSQVLYLTSPTAGVLLNLTTTSPVVQSVQQ
jgi:hypothetical protein